MHDAISNAAFALRAINARLYEAQNGRKRRDRDKTGLPLHPFLQMMKLQDEVPSLS